MIGFAGLKPDGEIYFDFENKRYLEMLLKQTMKWKKKNQQLKALLSIGGKFKSLSVQQRLFNSACRVDLMCCHCKVGAMTRKISRTLLPVTS